MRYTESNIELIKSMGEVPTDENQATLWDKLNPKCPEEKKAGDTDVPDNSRG